MFLYNTQKYEQPCGEEESDEEEIEDEDDTTSAESDETEEEEEEEEAIGNKGDKQNTTRQDQLEWDDSTLPYQSLQFSFSFCINQYCVF